MELALRYTTGRIKKLFKDHKIDAYNFTGHDLNDEGQRLKITLAGIPDANRKEVEKACDELTPAEHMDLIVDAVKEALNPKFAQEASAKAANPDKSEA